MLRHDAVIPRRRPYGVPDPYWESRSRRTVTLRQGRTVAPEELLAACEGGFARYKLPKKIRFAERLPRNAAGKVLRRDLRQAATRDRSDS